MAVALTDPSTNAVQPSSLAHSGPVPLRRNKSIPAMKVDPGPVSMFGQTPRLVVTRDGSGPGQMREPLGDDSGPKSLPNPKRSNSKLENTVRFLEYL